MPNICESLKTPLGTTLDPENHPAGRLRAHAPIVSYSTCPSETHRIALPAGELLK